MNPLRNSSAFPEYVVLAETEHYEVMFKESADKFSEESNYFVILKGRNTIESRDRAFSIAMVHMYDAEGLLTSVLQTLANDRPEPVRTPSTPTMN